MKTWQHWSLPEDMAEEAGPGTEAIPPWDREELAEEPTIPGLTARLWLLGAIWIAVFVIILGRLYFLQIVQGPKYRQQAADNSFRILSVPAPRGVIYDRDGDILARNQATFSVSVVPADLPEEDLLPVLGKVARLLGRPLLEPEPTGPGIGSTPLGAGLEEPLLNQEKLRQIEEGRLFDPFTPIPLALDVPRETAFIIHEDHLNLPGVIIETRLIREYLEGALTAHVLGFTGFIPPEAEGLYRARGYDTIEINQDRVGMTGLERVYQEELRGARGRKSIEADATGREVRVLSAEPPVPGHNLILNLDLDLQRKAWELCALYREKLESPACVVVALDPRDGRVRALISQPSFNNRLFQGVVDPEAYQDLLTDPLTPMLNRAITGEYPVGSIIKPIHAVGGLEEGVVGPNTIIVDRGIMFVSNIYNPSISAAFYGWREGGLGPMNIVSALQWSSDIYFYQLAGGYQNLAGLGLERLTAWEERFGLGAPTGIDLPAEASGLVPDEAWKLEVVGEPWYLGDTYNQGIGQGFLLSTPVQMANAVAAAANGGTLYRPQLVNEIWDWQGNVVQRFQPEVVRHIPISPETARLVREGMHKAVTSGTAQAWRIEGFEFAGKTGTAEFAGPRNREGNLPTHAWFTAFAPFESPELAMVVLVEDGGEGSGAAAPLAAELIRFHFGLPPGPGAEGPPAWAKES